jgi:EAL domain-containing protein (putative c-di-GMP-specific phosphodiesterase class I)
MIPELYKDRTESKRELLAFVAEVKNAFESLIVLGDTNYFISFTAGVALFHDNNLSPHELLKYAESALFEAKEKARGTVQFYEEERHGSAVYDLTIANDIHKAIRNNELSIRYQPQQDIRHGTLVGAEALVRWIHPQKGEISPARFIPIAEEYGAIIELEDWIFERIFQDIRKMSNALNEFPLNYIAVNVSSAHFLQPSFVEKFTNLVHMHQIDPAWINIEITESGLMRSIDEAAAKIQELKRLGFGFSIDDFGTGYSSLAYLKNLPVDIIKIDRSFVKDADRNDGDRLIVESVIEICQKFGFKVLAEGIDRQETLDYFKTTSCKTFQGYLYYKPLKMEEFIQII